MTALRGGSGAARTEAGAAPLIGAPTEMGRTLCRLLIAIWITFAVVVTGTVAISLALSQFHLL
jgi:hypothetical protein